MKTTITFPSRGDSCMGDLYLPSAAAPGVRRPALVVGHGFGGTRDLLGGQSQYFADAGYVVLAIDYRFFGGSGGEPRDQLFPLEQVEDFRNAITYLQGRDDVDPQRIGIWGTSFGGGVVIYTAAVDRRVKAVVAQAPIVNGRRWMKAVRAEGEWDELLDRLDADRVQRFASGRSERIPLGGNRLDAALPMSHAERRVIEELDDTPMGRQRKLSIHGASGRELALESIERIIEFFPDQFVHLIAPRALRIITPSGRDVVHPIDQIYDCYRRANEPKDLVLMPMDTYYEIYVEGGMARANASAVEWFDRYLAA